MSEAKKADWDVRFFGKGTKAQCPPNPAYPEGMTVDLSKGAIETCVMDLPYPAPEVARGGHEVCADQGWQDRSRER